MGLGEEQDRAGEVGGGGARVLCNLPVVLWANVETKKYWVSLF